MRIQIQITKFTSLVIIILIFIALTNCKKSDSPANPPITSNGFMIDSTFYNTEKAGIAIIAADTFALIFYSNSVSLDSSEQQWVGTGNAVAYDELICNNSINGYPVGTFSFKQTAQTGFFTEALTRKKYNFTQDTGVEYSCVRGTINIVKSGTQFQITYTLINHDSSAVVGEFKGILPDITSWFKKKKRIK